MASISSNPQGFRRLLFHFQKRHTIHLGNIPLKVAQEIKTRIEYLLASLKANLPMDGVTSQWLDGLHDELYSKLVRYKLVPARAAKRDLSLGLLLEEFFGDTKWTKNRTRINHRAAKRCLLDYFGSSRDVSTITELNAEEYRTHLGNDSAENTVRRRCSYARQYFKHFSEKLKLITDNPFGSMKNLTVEGDEDKFFFIDKALAQRVLDALPDAEWRLVFGLCRWGGFRCPSEHIALRWQDIDWQKLRIVLNSPKTGKRTLPLFPELIPLLKAMPKTGDQVFPEYQAYINLGKEFKRLVRLAGIEPWPKIFQNLRSTRETELLEKFPLHVVCSWIGNTERIARMHYLQTTEEHFSLATREGASLGSPRSPSAFTTKLGYPSATNRISIRALPQQQLLANCSSQEK